MINIIFVLLYLISAPKLIGILQTEKETLKETLKETKCPPGQEKGYPLSCYEDKKKDADGKVLNCVPEYCNDIFMQEYCKKTCKYCVPDLKETIYYKLESDPKVTKIGFMGKRIGFGDFATVHLLVDSETYCSIGALKQSWRANHFTKDLDVGRELPNISGVAKIIAETNQYEPVYELLSNRNLLEKMFSDRENLRSGEARFRWAMSVFSDIANTLSEIIPRLHRNLTPNHIMVPRKVAPNTKTSASFKLIDWGRSEKMGEVVGEFVSGMTPVYLPHWALQKFYIDFKEHDFSDKPRYGDDVESLLVLVALIYGSSSELANQNLTWEKWQDLTWEEWQDKYFYTERRINDLRKKDAITWCGEIIKDGEQKYSKAFETLCEKIMKFIYRENFIYFAIPKIFLRKKWIANLLLRKVKKWIIEASKI